MHSRTGAPLISWFTSFVPQAATSMLTLLDKLDNWIDEIPPLPTPQRFGNLAFRTWGRKLEDVRYLMRSLRVLSHLIPCI